MKIKIKMSYEDIPEDTRNELALKIIQSAYHNDWINWCRIYKNEIDAELRRSYTLMLPCANTAMTERQYGRFIRPMIRRIRRILLAGYTRQFYNNYIEGSSWEQSINESIIIGLDRLSDILKIGETQVAESENEADNSEELSDDPTSTLNWNTEMSIVTPDVGDLRSSAPAV